MPAELADLTLRQFLDQLASKTPTPGGGSVAALSGALAAGLAEMVCSYTLGNPKFAPVEPRIAELARELTRARHMLVDLLVEDADAYAELNAAFRIDKSDAARPAKLARAAETAAAVPLEVAALAARLIPIAAELESIANPQLRSDAVCARYLATAAIAAARENVRVNLPFLAPDAAQRVRSQLDASNPA